LLDPEWTWEKSYSHADKLLAILAEHDKKTAAQQEREETDVEDR